MGGVLEAVLGWLALVVAVLVAVLGCLALVVLVVVVDASVVGHCIVGVGTTEFL